jgi:pimeloyl-ACP methyl ester carboxylesterase
MMVGMITTVNTSPAVHLHYDCVGSGPDVLLVHGWASSGSMWKPLTNTLRRHARCWSIDLAGFGDSPLPSHIRPDVDAHLNWIIDFLELHNVKPRVVIGHSMGGLLSLKLAHVRPDLAERLVLMCPVVTGRFAFNTNQVFTSQLWMMMAAKTEKFWTLMQSEPLAAVFGAPLYLERATRERYMRDFQRARWDASVAALESLAKESMLPYLHRLQQPSLVIVGMKDFTVPPDEGLLAASHMPNAHLVEFPLSHHQPLDEEPEACIREVEAFFVNSGLL